MATSPYRGHGGRAYERQRDALKRRCQSTGQGCTNCGQPFDYNNPNSPRGFTADHPNPLAAGGRLLGQQLVPLCRSCNARKGDTLTPTIRPAS